jgi:hypothetical protein
LIDSHLRSLCDISLLGDQHVAAQRALLFRWFIACSIEGGLEAGGILRLTEEPWADTVTRTSAGLKTLDFIVSTVSLIRAAGFVRGPSGWSDSTRRSPAAGLHSSGVQNESPPALPS